MRPPLRGLVCRVLVATDGSPGGDHALDVARQLAGPGTAIDLAVVTVRRRGEVPVGDQERSWRPRPSAGPTLAPEILIGHPSVEIVREAERRGASLIIIGRRSVEAAGTAMLGPTADQIVRGASVPCLVLPLGPWRSSPRILAAVDGTERGERVLAGARVIAQLLEGTARSVTVVGAPGLGSSGCPASDAARVVRSGDPVEEILDEARAELEVLAVGVHRLGRPDSEGEQGTARRILRRSVGPVLTIPL